MLSAVLIPSTLFAQTPTVPTFSAGKLSANAEGPVIDGRVTDSVWQGVQPYTTFTQQDPNQGAPATERTEVRVLVGKGNVYVGIIAFDSDPSKIIVSQARRDASLSDTDSIVMVFDTFNDRQNAFVFGTNPLGIEYDGQVAREGQTSGVSVGGGGGGNSSGTARGGISAFNPNWDGDWTVKSQITERGWEAELAIPLKTLRYQTGDNQTWGFNLLRNIRHKNEQVFLAPIPRGFDIYRVSLAAKMTGLDLPARRDIKLIPYALGSVNKDYTIASDQLTTNRDFGVDVKWGIRPNLTLDATYNTDFAQVEADEEQVNLTRFDLFFPEKRPFFLENASTFQFGNPQQIDLFFSRRIGLSPSALPIDIRGGARLSGKVAGWNVGLLNIQADDINGPGGGIVGPANNFGVLRLQREVGRSSYGGIFVSRQGFGPARIQDDWNRAYGFDANWQLSTNQRISAFIARTDTPATRTTGPRGSDYSGRAFYNFTNQLWQVSGGYSQVGDNFNPEVGFLPRRGYWRPEFRAFFQPQPKRWPSIRRFAPHVAYTSFRDLQTSDMQSENWHIHPLEIQPRQGGRFGWFFDYLKDAPTAAFTVFNRDGRRVMIPAGIYGWGQHGFEYFHNPASRVTATVRVRIGNYYDGGFRSLELTSDYRITPKATASVGWIRQDIDLPYGSFINNLVPIRANYSFTTLRSLSALLQYNGQTGQFSSNVRFAWLNRSGTGLFIVLNDRRDLLSSTPQDTLGRSFVVKYTRLVDF
ncbi:MAG: carbohydrate binding family 9 domain-containing protein [Cyanobacteria bacterium]|nr:carbohydrate binding family 9 domain-containing protein [Cyanobacteriota bacterium]